MASVISHESGHAIGMSDLEINVDGVGINGVAYGRAAAHALTKEAPGGRQYFNNDNFHCVAFWSECGS